MCTNVNQKVANEYDLRTKTNCKRFLENLKRDNFLWCPPHMWSKTIIRIFYLAISRNELNGQEVNQSTTEPIKQY
jgi:hypothetical protein